MTASPPDSALLREAEVHLDSAIRRFIRRLFPFKTPENFQAQGVSDVRTFQPTSEGSGVFGNWELDNHGLPCYRYIIDQYQEKYAYFPNTARIDRRDHWHQIGNDRLTALVSNDGTVQVYAGDRGGVFLNLFAARDEATLPLEKTEEKIQDWLLSLIRQILRVIGRLYLKYQVEQRRIKIGKPVVNESAQYATSSTTAPRHIADTQTSSVPEPSERQPARYAFAGGFGYLSDGVETWSTAYRYRQPGSDVQRLFGLGYAETQTVYRNVRVTRRVYAPYGDHSFLLIDLDFENLGTEPVDLRYYEYWDINVHQLKLQWLRGNPFSAAGDAERSAINELFQPQLDLDESWNALRFHQHLMQGDIDLEAINEIDFSPADIFLADLTGQPTAHYTDKFVFFGNGTPCEPEAVKSGLGTVPNAPSTDSMPYCLTLRRDLKLAPGEQQPQRYAFGMVRPNTTLDFLEPFRQNNWLAQTLTEWQKPLVYFHTEADATLKREMAWHAYYLLSSTVYNAYFKTHLIPQGSAYLYIHGADGAPRDQALFTIPLVYLRPDLARETLKLVMALQHHVTGAIAYSFSGYGIQNSAFIHDSPSDLDLFFLLALNEYLAATGDNAFLNERVPFYSPDHTRKLPSGAQDTTVLDHVRAAVKHLIHGVGTGDHGLIKIGDGDWSDGVVFETVTRMAGVLFPVWFQLSKTHGESIPNTQMALYVLPLSAALLKMHDAELAEEITHFMAGLEAALHKQWNGQWYTRAILRNATNQPIILDHDRINLEAQPWALISSAARNNGVEDALIASALTLLDEPSPTGTPMLEGGLVWPAVSQLMTWGYCRSRPDLAWRSLLRNSFAVHAAVFPNNWINIWSGPDAVFSKASTENPGGTWNSSATPMIDFPVMNANPHAMALVGLLRVCGIEPSEDGSGLNIDPHVPRENFTLDTPLLKIEIAPGSISGEYRPIATGERTLHVRVPDGSNGISAQVGEQGVTVELDQSRFVRLKLNMTAGIPIPFSVSWTVTA